MGCEEDQKPLEKGSYGSGIKNRQVICTDWSRTLLWRKIMACEFPMRFCFEICCKIKTKTRSRYRGDYTEGALPFRRRLLKKTRTDQNILKGCRHQLLISQSHVTFCLSYCQRPAVGQENYGPYQEPLHPQPEPNNTVFKNTYSSTSTPRIRLRRNTISCFLLFKMYFHTFESYRVILRWRNYKQFCYTYHAQTFRDRGTQFEKQ